MLSIPIIAFGLLMLIAGAIIMVKPDLLMNYLRANLEKPALYSIAILARLLLGGLIVFQSPQSSFPKATLIVGWILVITGLGLMAMGQSKFKRLTSWVINAFAPFIRIASVLAFAFGGFLIYAFT